jgi:hypothetical protein
MTAIWYAISIYMIGIAVILYLRPKTMFRDDGMWKEFGLQKDGTVFPFWMFAIVWAVLAYALASLMSMMFAAIVLNSSESSVGTPVQAVQSVQPASIMQPISQAPMMNIASSEVPKVPGYYILDPYSSGAPRYIYYGTSPPGV